MTDHHYFASSFLNWTTGRSIEEVERKQKRVDARTGRGIQISQAAIYRVPLPMTAQYAIRDFKPNVPGVELVKMIKYV